MLKKTIALHSFKGGTGKTSIAVNLAALYAAQGKNICLLDLDFRAPSLQVIFRVSDAKLWLNDFLNGLCEIRDILIDLTPRYRTKGKFYIGLANPSIEAVQDMLTKSRKDEMKALHRLLSMKAKLFEDMKIDCIILDTSPGLQYSSMNAVVASDVTLIVSVNDEADIDGTQRMMRNFYDVFEKKSAVLMNKILCEDDYREKEKNLFEQFKVAFDASLLGMLPLYCDILQSGRASVIVLENPHHPFTQILSKVAERI